MCWHFGGSQSDVALFIADNIYWENGTICYLRAKLKNKEKIKTPLIQFGKAVAQILKALPQSGALFPNLCKVQSKDRANEFRQRCHGLGIMGITLHSYRYAWAERARKAGYPQQCVEDHRGGSFR